MSERRLDDVYRTHAPGARRLAYLLTRDAGAAEDVTQEAFIRCAGRFAHLRKPESFRPYLYRTIVNLAKNHNRSRARERARYERVGVAEDHAPAPDTSVETWDILQSLPTRQAAAIVLRYYHLLTTRQVSEVLNCSEDAAKSLIRRGLESFRRSYEGGHDD